MNPVGHFPLRVWVIGGEEIAGALSEGESDVARSVDVDVADPEASEGGLTVERPVDVVVVEEGGDRCNGTDTLEPSSALSDVPVVLVVDEWDDERVAEALSAGVTAVLPRRLFETDPGSGAERVIAAADSEHTWSSFRELYDNITGIATLHDPESGEVIHANRALCDLLGYDRDELLSMQFGEFTADVPGYNHQRVTNAVSSVTERDDPIEFEWPVLTAEETVRWIEARICPVRIGGRELVLSTSVDVTERRRQERRYQQVFENVNDVISIHDPWDAEIVDVNERMADLTGYSREALLEMGLTGISVTEDGYTAERAYELQRRVAATGEAETVEWIVETASGERRVLEANLTPATVAGEDRVLALSRDVTERREYERRLERERDRRSVLFGNNPDPVVRVEFEEGDPIIREVNAAFEDVFGFPADEVVGSSVADAVVPEGERAAHERLRAQVARGAPVESVAPRQTADGTREFLFRVIHFGTDPADEDTTDAYVWYTDVTERRRRERIVRQLHEATETVQTAETEAEVCEATVTAAAEVLDLSTATCWIETADSAALTQIAGGRPSPPDSTDANGMLGPEHPAYEVYETGEAHVFEPGELPGTPSPECEEGRAGDSMFVPVGDRGLFNAVESTESRFDDITLDVVRILARHADTALERVERARELRESERRFRLIADHIDEVIYLSEPDFSEVFYANSAYEDVWGQPVEELYADPRGFIDQIDPRDREEFRSEFESMLADIERGEADDSYVFEFRIQPSEGAIRWVRATGYPVDRSAGETRFVGVVDDVTERRELERTYRDVFENVSDGLVVHDPETGEIRDVNERFCEMNGYGRDDLVGETIDVVTAPDHSYELAREQIKAARDEGPQLFEWRNERKDGEAFPVEVHLSVVDVRGEERVLGSVRDITERKRREREYEQIFDGVNDSITIHDPETAELLDVNETFCQLLGGDREEILERGIEGYSPEEMGYTMSDARQFVREVVESDEPKQTEWAVETRDGEIRWLEVKGTTVEIGGELRYVSINRDVTERRRREREYEQIFDGVNDSIVIQDPETAQPVDVNQAFLDRLGYDDVEAIRREGFEGLTASDEGYTTERAQAICQRVMETGDPETVEWRQETSDGERRWIEATVDTAVIQGEDRILSIQRDVTERKRRERMVRSLHEATDDLHDAEAPEDVCEAAVAAATEVLDLSNPTVWLREDDAELLSPVAAAGRERDRSTAGPEQLEPGDPEFDVYRRGEAAVRDATPGGTISGSANRFLVPLGEHGLFGATDPAVGSLAEVTRDAARILARHVTSALDRVERARELRESDRRFRLIAEHIDEIVYLATADFSEILYINPVYEDIYGRPIDELDEEPTAFVDAAHPEDRDRYESDLEGLIEDVEAGSPQAEYEGTYRIERGDEVRWVNTTRFPVADEDGNVDRIVGRVQDVTERTRREREYEQIFDGITDPITVNDPETGEILRVNEAMCELLGYDHEEVLERNLQGISVTEEGYTLDRAREAVRRVVESGESETFEWKLETAAGEHRTLEVTGTPAVIGGEERYLSLTRDITEQRRTERRLGAILDRIDEAIFMTRADEITTDAQVTEYVSAGHEAIWGRSLGEIRDTYDDGFFGTIHPDDEADHEAFVERVAQEIADGEAGDRYANEYRIERLDGEVRWVESTYYPTEWDGGHPRVVVVSRDVTDRKARERRIASFDEATDDLATADTPEEATRAAVEAATETLNVPAVGAFLYDETDGVLEPEVVAGPLPTDVVESPIEPGDGPLWEGFAAGTIVAPDGGQTDPGLEGKAEESPDELAGLTAWRGIALGNHGILLVGTPEGSLRSETIQAAHVLAATLEAALNHLEGRQRLAAQEEQLRRQTERAERLDRIARLTRQVEAAITDASGPDEVEQAVCERLAGSGPYDLAWTAGVEVGSDRLAARAVVGAPHQYVERMDLTTAGGSADPHPAVAAWDTDEAHVVNSLVGDGPSDSWRRQSLSRGYQSVCSVPLTYDGVTHGVLTVVSESPNEFGDRERAVLSQLGTSIANAVAAIERRRALESDETVELEFGGAGDELPFARLATAADCRVRLERSVSRQDGSVSVYFSLREDVPDDAGDLAARTLPGTVDVVADDQSSTLVEVQTDDWFGSPLAEYGGVLREATAEPDETEITVEVPREADVRAFVGRLEAVAPTLELVAKRQHRRQDRTPAEFSDRIRTELTDRQFEVLQTALTAGYFEWPREHDGSEVADRLDITQPTFNKHLRLAERQTFDILFGEDA